MHMCLVHAHMDDQHIATYTDAVVLIYTYVRQFSHNIMVDYSVGVHFSNSNQNLMYM